MVGEVLGRTCAQKKVNQMVKHWNTLPVWVVDFPSPKVFEDQVRDILIRN